MSPGHEGVSGDKRMNLDDLDKDSPDDYFDSIHIDGIQLASIKHLGPYKVVNKSRDQAKKLFANEPPHDTLEKIYNHYCSQTHAVPVRFLHLYENGWLNLLNFNFHANNSLALACVIPVKSSSLISFLVYAEPEWC